MRMIVGLFACTLFFGTVGFAGCSTDNKSSSGPGAIGAGVGGSSDTGYAKTCNNKAPDGYCNAKGANPEDCACPDCTEAATCTSKCQNDGVCNHEAGEDCTCDDCYGKQGPDQGDFQCPPFSVGCDGKPEGECNELKDCTCDFCKTDARCKSCDHNGSCVPYLENCDCDDCKPTKECGGNGTTSSTSNAAASTAAASTSSSGGAGGAGGAGGSPGAGGAGGAGGN